jgi:uncharacterized membrane protein
MKKKERGFFSKDDIGIIGSYSSFLALLLVATILAFRSFVEYLIELPAASAEHWFIVMIIVIGVVFVVMPSIPIITSIVRGFKKRNYWLSFFLIFILVVYFFAVTFQFGYTLIDQVLK